MMNQCKGIWGSVFAQGDQSLDDMLHNPIWGGGPGGDPYGYGSTGQE